MEPMLLRRPRLERKLAGVMRAVAFYNSARLLIVYSGWKYNRQGAPWRLQHARAIRGREA